MIMNQKTAITEEDLMKACGTLDAYLSASGGRFMKPFGTDDNDVPVFGMIVVKGHPETQEIKRAVEAIEAQWDADESEEQS